MLKRLVVEKLFGTFDYSINLKPEGLTILTGPNGYGKTTILRILEEFTNKNFIYFLGLHFKKIELLYDDFEAIITKNENSDICLQVGDQKTTVKAERIYKRIMELLPFRKLENDIWVNQNHSRTNTRDVLRELAWLFQSERREQHFYARPSRRRLSKRVSFVFQEFLDFLDDTKLSKVLHIETLRLLRRIQNDGEDEGRRYSRGLIRQTYYEEIIDDYAERLMGIMSDVDAQYAAKSRELDSSYPSRLLNSSDTLSEADFRLRFSKIKETQKLLANYGLSIKQADISPDHLSPRFDSSNAKALSVYLSDVETKLQVFEQLLNALNLFSESLNSRRFVNKRIVISKDFGLKFITNDDIRLALTELSSGEQHQVVLFFDLLFCTDSSTLILIDEPEMSLHIAWQHDFLAELRKIIAIRKAIAIVSTHSPQIIGNEWSSVYDLYDLEKGK